MPVAREREARHGSGYGQSATLPVAADLGDGPVRVDVELTGLPGTEPFRESTTAAPSLHQPNGASCDGSGYVRVGGPLDDGSSNPPEGWGNPEPGGRLRLDGDLATFTDDAGHEEVFQLSAPGPPRPPLCA